MGDLIERMEKVRSVSGVITMSKQLYEDITDKPWIMVAVNKVVDINRIILQECTVKLICSSKDFDVVEPEVALPEYVLIITKDIREDEDCDPDDLEDNETMSGHPGLIFAYKAAVRRKPLTMGEVDAAA